MVNFLLGGSLITLVLVSILRKSYFMWGFLGVALFAFNGSYGAGVLTYALTIILLMIIFRFIRKQRRYARTQKQIYRTGREQAKWAKVFNKGFDDEYYR